MINLSGAEAPLLALTADCVLLPSGLGPAFLCVSEPAVVAIGEPLAHGVRGPGSGDTGLWPLGGTTR